MDLGSSIGSSLGVSGDRGAKLGPEAFNIRSQKLSTTTAGRLKGSPRSLLLLLGGSHGPWGSPAVIVDSSLNIDFSSRLLQRLVGPRAGARRSQGEKSSLRRCAFCTHSPKARRSQENQEVPGGAQEEPEVAGARKTRRSQGESRRSQREPLGEREGARTSQGQCTGAPGSLQGPPGSSYLLLVPSMI